MKIPEKLYDFVLFRRLCGGRWFQLKLISMGRNGQSVTTKYWVQTHEDQMVPRSKETVKSMFAADDLLKCEFWGSRMIRSGVYK